MSGCATTGGLPDAVHDGGKSESTGASEPAKSEPPEPASHSPAIEGIIAEAPEDCIFAIVKLPDGSSFDTFGEPTLTMDMSGYYPGLPCETVLLVPIVDGISIDVERFELHEILEWQVSNELLYHFDGNTGEFYSLNTFMTEGLPTMSVTASIAGKESVWNCATDSMLGQEIRYLGSPLPPEEEIFFSAPYVVQLSGAAATCRMVFGDDGFRETVAYGIAQTETYAPYTVDDNGYRFITLNWDRFASYVETLFPGMTAWPPWDGPNAERFFSYNEASETYEIRYFDITEIASWSAPGFKEDEDRKGGTITVMVSAPGFSASEQAYEVVWREKKLRGENDPIAFEIIEVREVQTGPVG